jgi:hypothetical protein
VNSKFFQKEKGFFRCMQKMDPIHLQTKLSRILFENLAYEVSSQHRFASARLCPQGIGDACPQKDSLADAWAWFDLGGNPCMGWVPYYYLKIVSNQPVDVMDYLPIHLVGVLVECSISNST